MYSLLKRLPTIGRWVGLIMFSFGIARLTHNTTTKFLIVIGLVLVVTGAIYEKEFEDFK
jgi:hypothetical protein